MTRFGKLAHSTNSGRRLTAGVAVVSLALLGSPVLSPAAQADPPTDESTRRIGVLAVAGAISAVGQTPELATPLPFTQTSLADVLALDEQLTAHLQAAMTGDDNLAAGLEQIPEIDVDESETDDDTIVFTYSRRVTDFALPLVHDDGDLRFGKNDGAGDLDVSLVTDPDHPFKVQILDEDDPLLRVALVSQPELDLSVDIDTPDLQAFDARQGFTDVRVTGGHYSIDRDQHIRMRDPDGRSLLTLEDLRYSTLPDLFRVETPSDAVDVELGISLPDSLAGGTGRAGTLTLDGTPQDAVWPTAEDATRDYGPALAQATGLSMADGLTSLAQYTGTVLALQDAANVPFPNLGGGTSDLFAPGDQLLGLLSTAAAAQIRCGASPTNPPTGVAAPGDTVYCDATTADGLGTLSVSGWTLHDAGSLSAEPDEALGTTPSGLVQVDGSDGEPDLSVDFTATPTSGAAQQLTARSMPRTVQDVVDRISGLAGSTASAQLTAGRLDVAVGINRQDLSTGLPLGNPDELGALVGLTGLSAPGGQATGTATAASASFDVGFGIQTGEPAAGAARGTYLLPADGTLLDLDGLDADVPSLGKMTARIGFLGVDARLDSLSLGQQGAGPAAELDRVTTGSSTATDPLLISDLLTGEGALDPDQLKLTSRVTAGIGFTATEQPLTAGGSDFATGADGPASGTATVNWSPGGLPDVVTDAGYADLRVFDPVPAAFLSGTAHVTPGNPAGPDDDLGTPGDNGAPDTVRVDLPTGTDLYDVLNVSTPADDPGTGADVEVARRLLAEGLACQNVTITDPDSLTCDGLAPNGVAGWGDDQSVELIVLGDPFAMRDSVIEGLSAALSGFDRITDDGLGDFPDDQYTSTLPLADLTPAQLAVERDALRVGLAAISDAATADELGSAAHPVSSAQELKRSVPQLVQLGGAAGLTYTLDASDLGIALTAATPGNQELAAKLRFTDAARGQVSSTDLYDVAVDSTTTLAIDVDRATSRPAVSDATGTTSTATLGLAPAQLGEDPVQAGITDFTLTDNGSSADLGITVDTDYVVAADGSGTFETTRANARSAGRAAVAQLDIGADGVLDYAADATDSSGGTGTSQPPPDAMQVKYVAEGLDGLATALESAMDGAAPRNLGPDGAPVAAPLIGTDLDAGAGVPDKLHTLTSSLRDELEKPAVTGAADAAALKTALKAATETAIDRTDGFADHGAVTVDVTCGGTDGACEPCPEPTEDTPDPGPCTVDSPTGWDTVTISTTLSSDGTKSGQTEFDTGLAGLAVHSNQKVDTETSWSLPVTLQLQRGVGPQVVVGEGEDPLALEVEATLPDTMKAVVGYLPAELTPTSESAGTVQTTVNIAPDEGTYDLFDLYDGKLTATPSFSDPAGVTESDGISLDFTTLAGNKGGFDLLGNIDIPWRPADGYDEITYNDVRLDVGEVLATIATPFAVVDPYLAPVRDVVDVLRTPIPVISDLSELAGGGEVSLLSLLETLSAATEKPQLEMAHRVIGLIGGVTDMLHGVAALAEQDVPLENLSDLGAALTLQPSEVALYEKCTQSVKTSTTTAASTPGGTPTTTVKKTAPKPCPDTNIFANQKKKKSGAAGQTTAANRAGTRKGVKQQVGRRTTAVTGSLPGFSLPFLSDPDQLLDLVTGEGEASYFRLDLGTLSASVAYTQRFGPIMAGPVPIMPFVGGSISVEGRLAMGFDSHAQTLAVESLSDPGDADELLGKYDAMDGGDIIREGFYLDDLDSDGVDVPEVKIVTTLEAGAGVSIGIVTAGLKGGITLTINLDLNDPNDDGKVRTAEIRDMFQGNAKCIFDASATLEAFISVFVEIQLLLTTLNYDFDILRLGPYTLFEYGCPDQVPTLVKWDDGSDQLLLTSGSRSGQRVSGAVDGADDFKVRQFARPGGTEYEVEGFGRVQVVDVKAQGDGWDVTIYESGLNISTANPSTVHTTVRPTFGADGGNGKDKLSFLQGERFDDTGTLHTTPFDTRVTALTGGSDDDVLVTGAGDDAGIDGGPGADNIDTGDGHDLATGGEGNDIVTGGAGRDDLSGAAGDDRLQGGPGGDRANGGDGNDSLVGGPGRDVRAVLVLPENTPENVVTEQVRAGFDSGDVLVGAGGADTVDGGDGSDVVVGGDAAGLTAPALGSLFETRDRTVSVLEEGNTNPGPMAVDQDTAKVPGAAALDGLCESGTPLSGAGSTDFVTGGAEADVVVGGNGADTLDGGGGPDDVCGRAGGDQLIGDGAQADADGNADVIRGGHGDDRAEGGPGDDVMFGDDVVLFRGTGDDAHRVLDGSLGNGADGNGADFLDGGEGDDVQSGGAGSDLLLGAAGDDATYGEGQDTGESGGDAPDVSQRLLACHTTTRVVAGLVDLDGDLLAGEDGVGITPDSGQLAGLHVTDGKIKAPDGSDFTGLLGGTVVVAGVVDYDRDGDTSSDRGDTGMIPLASMLGTGGSNADGDCILAGDGNDQALGGSGSDYVGSGAGTDLASGGDGNDLVLGDDGVDVVLGGPHHDVLVGGTGDDHLMGGDGDDRLHGNEGADDLVGGSDAAGADDGEDVLFGGRENDVLAAENADAVSEAVVEAVMLDVPDETTVDDPDDTVAAVPWRDADYVPASVTAGASSALRFDDSALRCDVSDDPSDDQPGRWLTVLRQDGTAGEGTSSPGVAESGRYDELYGGYDCDFVFGSTGDDLVRGGQDDDVVEGGPGADVGYGDDDDDVVVGGSTFDHFETGAVQITTDRDGSGVADVADTLRGDGGPDGAAYDGDDLLVGDNALPIRQPEVVDGPDYVVTLRDVGTVARSAPGAASGADTIRGDAGVDRILGQGGPDMIDGGEGDDYLEGNNGGDEITGDNGSDDVIGGSSAVDGRPLGATGDRLQAALAGPFDDSAAGLLDNGTDLVRTGAGEDVVLGDNGRITRPGVGSLGRHIAKADEDGTAHVSDGDDIGTGADADRAFGQGGHDVVDAGSENDHVEGNEGVDGLAGGAGADVVIGGSSVSPDGRGTLDDAVDNARTQLDGNDVIYGDLASDVTAASDLLLGDNATVLFLSGLPVVQLADVATTGSDPAAGTSGGDTIHGGEPADATLAAPDKVFGQGGDDTIDTGSSGDYVEGNVGDDGVDSGAGDDDVIGGSSASNGRPLGETGERLRQRMSPERLDPSAAGELDGDDVVDSGSGEDTVLGDNGRITRPTGGQRPVPDVTMSDTEDATTYGSDQLFGRGGDDVLYGQLDDGSDWGEGDRLEGGGGHDTLLGDLAVVDRTPAGELSAPRTLALKSDAISEDVYPSGSIVPQTWVPQGQARNGGPDLALGGAGDDVLHLGGGSDLGNGGADDDVLFGGDADDAMWGGLDHDRMFGGYGDDDIDLKLRTGDPAAYADARDAVDGDEDVATTNGDDLVYGGWGADEMQADVGAPGRHAVSDHLVDWVGAHNVYYVCGGAYGAGRIIRQSGPGMRDLLTDLAQAAGGRELTLAGSGGWYDLGMVDNSDKKDNNKRSPEHPGHFTCG